jgi:hypothetical protein
MWMALAGHHFAGAFAVTLGAPAAHEAAMVEQEPQWVLEMILFKVPAGKLHQQP